MRAPASIAAAASEADGLRVSLLTGGMDKPYALGLLSELVSRGVAVEFVGNDEMQSEAVARGPLVSYLNLRGDQDSTASLSAKATRVLRYYMRLMRYAATTKSRMLHILWNNKFEHFDRTMLLLYYKLLRKRIVLTAHNVNAHARDGKDNAINRWTLRHMYRHVDHIFVHTQKMKTELVDAYGVADRSVSVIPFGINDTLPKSGMTPEVARARLGLADGDRVLLFFGNIAPYKGLEDLVSAMNFLRQNSAYKLLIAGQIKKGAEGYWDRIEAYVRAQGLDAFVIPQIGYVPDEDVELYFKAADVFVLPYRQIFQSGVLFLGYNFGLPVIVTDVGALREEVVAGKTGYVCQAQCPAALADALAEYFRSDLYRNLAGSRDAICTYAAQKYSWHSAGDRVCQVYKALLSGTRPGRAKLAGQNGEGTTSEGGMAT